MKNIPLGVYHPGQSVIHRLQARTKLLALLWMMGLLFVANQRRWHFMPYLVVFAFLLVSVLLARIPLWEIWRRLCIIVVVAVIGSLFLIIRSNGDARPFYTWGRWQISALVPQCVLLGIGAILLLRLILSFLPVGDQKRSISFWRVFGKVLGIVVVMVLFFLIAPPFSSVPIECGPFVITYGGVWLVVTGSTVLILFYTYSLLLTMTTSPAALVEGMTLLLAPLRRLRLPVDDFALMLLLALRFMPVLFEETEQLIKAQISRGADFTRGSVRERLECLRMLFMPLILGTLRRASELSVALEARGYHADGKQTMLHEEAFGRTDVIVFVVVFVGMVGSLFV